MSIAVFFGDGLRQGKSDNRILNRPFSEKNIASWEGGGRKEEKNEKREGRKREGRKEGGKEKGGREGGKEGIEGRIEGGRAGERKNQTI